MKIFGIFRYLNTQFIKKQRFTEADLSYGGISLEQARQCMMEIGEVIVEIELKMIRSELYLEPSF
jgi:hypothetical protein